MWLLSQRTLRVIYYLAFIKYIMNIKFCYRYRDAANYKQHNEIIFGNPTKLLLPEIEKAIRKNLIDESWFVAKKWDVPDMHFKEYAWDSEIDHDWHEFDCIVETNESIEKISIADFLNHIGRTSIK